jgi:outer membrane receptor for ferrienterochelin and colicins
MNLSILKKIFFLSVVFSICISVPAQNSLMVFVKSEKERQPLTGASVTITPANKGASTDSLGFVRFTGLPDGTYSVEVSYVGFATSKKKITLPADPKIIEFELEESEDEDNSNVIITATRTDRSVKNTPTRVEVIAGGEISENVSMRPGEVRMLLNETTGLITQQTSAISNTANIRIQELEGRYTQVLRDGFPLYSGLSEGLSLVQIAPLDLKQVEIIKGSSSTLYGGGAIAGLINLVSKTPTEKRDLGFIANATSAGGLDLSGFYGERFSNIGLTVFASSNTGRPYDPSGISFTAIPKFSRYTITPRLFVYGKKTNANLGVSFITEDRLGGNMQYVKNHVPGYFEKNNSDRFTTQFKLTTQTGEHSSFTFKNSYNHFNRITSIPDYRFEGLQQSSFSEISFNAGRNTFQWVGGVNFYTDNFKERPDTNNTLRNYNYNTVGGFVQNTWAPNEKINIETGIRGDYTSPYGFVLLPSASALFHFNDHLSSRLGGGFGYKLPTIFTEESEEKQFRHILPVNTAITQYERSTGVNTDLTYTASFNKLKLLVNPLFFYTRVKHPLILVHSNVNDEFVNANGYTDSKGMDLTIRLTLEEIKFFTGYSYTVAQNHFNGSTTVYPLAPEHKLHFDLVYEAEGKLRLALESYYTGKQQLHQGQAGNPFWLIGALIEKSWKHFSLFINGEDLNNVKQTDFGPVYSGSLNSPDFFDIYAPMEGRTINGGIKIKL